MGKEDSMRLFAFRLLVLISIGTARAENPDSALLLVNEALEKAWSARDVAAIEKLWAHDGYVFIVHPSSKAPELGWPNVKKSFETQLSRYSEFSISMPEPRVHINGNTAFVVGLELFTAKRTTGEVILGKAIGTRGFEKKGDKWLIVFHQATPVRE
jgi:ketosteroid isomerase-like protein